MLRIGIKDATGIGKLEIVCDALEGDDTEAWSDLPLSFSSSGRRYADRAVRRYTYPTLMSRRTGMMTTAGLPPSNLQVKMIP